MKGTKQGYKAAKKFSNSNFSIGFECIFEGQEVYYEHDKSLDGAIVGYLTYIIVDQSLKCRYLSNDEVWDILSIEKYFFYYKKYSYFLQSV